MLSLQEKTKIPTENSMGMLLVYSFLIKVKVAHPASGT